MASAIDVTKPVAGSPTTESVRANFAAAKSEIELLQQTAGVGPQGPIGPTGPAGTVAVGTTTTGPAGSNATVTEAGIPTARVLNFTIPRGDTGAGGGGITETEAVEAVRQANPNFQEVPATIASIPTTQLAGAPEVGAGWELTAGAGATGTYTHTPGSTATLAYPVTGGMAVGQRFLIAFTGTNLTPLPDTAAPPVIFTVYLRTAPAATGSQLTVRAIRAIAAQTILLEITGTTLMYVVVVPVSAFDGTFSLTQVFRLETMNSTAFSIDGAPAVRRSSNILAIGGGGRATTGNFNTSFGLDAMKSVTAAQFSVMIGHNTGGMTTVGNYNVAVGRNALEINSNGGQNVAIGERVMQLKIAGNLNTGVGDCTLYQDLTGAENVAIGRVAMQNSRTGSFNTSIGTFSLNTMIRGDRNTAVGHSAGRYSGSGTTSLSNANDSTFLGAYTRSAATLQTNEIVIGYNALGGGSNTITLGNGDIEQLRCNIQTIAALSDTRVKDEIQPADLNLCLDAVKNLPVHRWHWQPLAGFRRDKHVTGFLSGELKKVFPHAVTTADEYLTVRDADGHPIMKTITETVESTEEGAMPEVQTREIEDTVKVEGLARVELTEILPTLWGAVQQLLTRIQALESRLPMEVKPI